MTTSIAPYWAEFKEAKAAIEKIMDTMSVDQVKRQPSDGGWSPVQVIEHLLLSETGTLGYMKKKSSSGWEDLDNEEPSHAENGEKLVERLKSDEKYKAPAILPEPPGDSSWPELKERWNKLREEYELFIQLYDDQFQHKLVFKQPFAGMITLEKTLQFLAHHARHHIPQIQALSDR